MPPSLTKGDLLEVVSDLRDHFDDRLDKVNEHLRDLNGSVARHEALGAAMQVEILHLKQQQRNTLSRKTDTDTDGDTLPVITKGDARNVWKYVAGVVAAIEAVRILGPYVKALLAVHG